jgi:predicted dehydrogenase
VLNIGIAGFGFMGRMHYRCWKARGDARIAAICDANPHLVEDAKKAVGNIGGAEAVDFTGVAVTGDLGEMLSKGKLDAVSLTLPTDLHAEGALRALAAGVHVLCEKPMALTAADCDRMIAAARASGKILQIGHCLRFWPEYVAAKEIVASGRYGRLLAASLRRLAATPTWSRDHWLLNEARSGGVALDLHVHDADYVQHLLGLPRAVTSFGARGPGGAVAHLSTRYDYGDGGPLVVAEGGWVMAPSFGFEMSFNLVLDRATVAYDSTRRPAFRICTHEGSAFAPPLPEGDGYVRQIDHFARAIRGEAVPPVITLEQSRDSVRIVEAEVESMRRGEPVALKA